MKVVQKLLQLRDIGIVSTTDVESEIASFAFAVSLARFNMQTSIYSYT